MERDRSGALKMLVGLEHIYIFLLHIFNKAFQLEAFQLEAFLKDIVRLVFSWLVEIRGRLHSSEERHMASTVGGALGILVRSLPLL